MCPAFLKCFNSLVYLFALFYLYSDLFVLVLNLILSTKSLHSSFLLVARCILATALSCSLRSFGAGVLWDPGCLSRGGLSSLGRDPLREPQLVGKRSWCPCTGRARCFARVVGDLLVCAAVGALRGLVRSSPFSVIPGRGKAPGLASLVASTSRALLRRVFVGQHEVVVLGRPSALGARACLRDHQGAGLGSVAARGARSWQSVLLAHLHRVSAPGGVCTAG